MLTLLNRQEIIDIYNKYMIEDFPPDELKPLSSILDMLSRGIYSCYGLFEGEKLLAYAYLTVLDDFVLVDYLAVTKTLRGGGIGTKLLTLLKELLKGKTILIECENPLFAKENQEKITQIRRLDFYKRNCFIQTNVTSVLFGVNYTILTYPESSTASQGLNKVYLEMLGKDSCDKNLIIK